MADILAQIQELQQFYDDHYKERDQYLKMFELAGFDLYTEPDDDGKSRPKDVVELLQEALGNLPLDAGNWIRIADIPRYVTDHLIVPDRQALDEFNGRRVSRSPVVQVESPTDEIAFNDKGEAVDYTYTGVTWKGPQSVPVGSNFVDQIGVPWHKKANNVFADLNTFDENKPDYSTNAEISMWIPLREIKYD